jgi:hypothetical protein
MSSTLDKIEEICYSFIDLQRDIPHPLMTKILRERTLDYWILLFLLLAMVIPNAKPYECYADYPSNPVCYPTELTGK